MIPRRVTSGGWKNWGRSLLVGILVLLVGEVSRSGFSWTLGVICLLLAAALLLVLVMIPFNRDGRQRAGCCEGSILPRMTRQRVAIFGLGSVCVGFLCIGPAYLLPRAGSPHSLLNVMGVAALVVGFVAAVSAVGRRTSEQHR